MVFAIATAWVLTAGLDGCDANNPYRYFPFANITDAAVTDVDGFTVVPRPVLGGGANWSKRSVNFDFDAGVDFELGSCTAHRTPRGAAHLVARARFESGWSLEPGIAFGWHLGELHWPGDPVWLASEIQVEVGPSFGVSSALSGIHARVGYWWHRFVGLELGLRYSPGQWVPSLSLRVDLTMLAVFVAVTGSAGRPPSHRQPAPQPAQRDSF